jgi:hypothetical protein
MFLMIIHTLSRLSLVILRTTVVLGLAGLCAFIHFHDSTLLDSITEMIQHHPRGTALLRWGIIGAFILLWPALVRKIGQQYDAMPQQIAEWCKKRWQISLWLLLIELLVCENLVGKLMHGLDALGNL